MFSYERELIFSSLQRLAVVRLLLWLNLTLSYNALTPVHQLDSRLVEANSRNVADNQHAPAIEVGIVDEDRVTFLQDPRRDATTTSSATAPQTSQAGGGLDSIISGFVDAFSCVGNASDLFAGLESLLVGLGADPTFIRATEDVLFSDNFTLFETPSFFLGIGIGEGTIVGLNASTEEQSRIYADSAIIVSGANDTGMNTLFRQFGQGLVNVTLPAVLSSTADDFLAGLNLSELVGGAGTGIADGIETVLKPVLGSTIFDVSVNSTGNFADPKGAGAVVYSFARGFAAQLTSLGLDLLGIGNTSKASMTLKLRSKDSAREGIDGRATVKDEMMGSVPERHSRGIILSEQNSMFGSSDPLLRNSSKTDQITSSLAQAAVSRLSCEGVGAAASLFSNLLSNSHPPVPSLPDVRDLKLPNIHLVVRNDGNLFEIGLQYLTATVNGVPLNKLIALLAAHIVVALATFLALFPSVLIVDTIGRLSITTGKPINPLKLSRWLMIIQVGVLPLLAIVGLILGIFSAGNSANFHTPHGVLGIVLVAMSLVYSVSTFIRHHGKPDVLNESPKGRSRVIVINNFVIALMMALIFATWITGLEDLRSLSLCIVDQISSTIVAAVSSIINGVWSSAVTITIVEWWISRRLSKVANLATNLTDSK